MTSFLFGTVVGIALAVGSPKVYAAGVAAKAKYDLWRALNKKP